MDSTTVPDFRGKTLKEVAQLIQKLGAKAIFNGNGIAIEQTPQPGEPFPDSRVVLVRFSATRD